MPTERTILFEVTGEQALIDNVKAIEAALMAGMPKAIELACRPTIAMMKRLAPHKTGALERSIRFTLGERGGAPKTFKRGRGSRGGVGKTYFIGYIVAGDETTLVSGGTPKPRGKGTGRKGKVAKGQRWQNARLQEFGTVKMPANPFFYPAWRATSKDVKAGIRKTLNGIIKDALSRHPIEPAAAQQEAA